MIHYITTNGIGNPWVSLELGVLNREKIPFKLHAMRLPDSVFYTSEWARDLVDQTIPIYPLRCSSLIFSVLLAPFIFGSRFFLCLWNACVGRRESFRMRIAAFAHLFVACHWARGLKQEKVTHIHSQWAHSCATIGMYGARLLGTTFSFTGHGADLWRDRVALEDKIEQAVFIVCISKFHRDFYLRNGADPSQLIMVYCGINPKLFFPKDLSYDNGQPFKIRSSGRLVEKKGFEDLIDACKILLDKEINIQCAIIGSGPLANELQQRVATLGLQKYIDIPGRNISHEEMNDFLHEGDIYCLPCVWASDNDADGLPAVLMEAMASGLPVISTNLVGIPDLISDGVNGLLVSPRDASSLATAIERLYEDYELAKKLAAAGIETVQKRFDLATCVDPLIHEFQKILQKSSR